MTKAPRRTQPAPVKKAPVNDVEFERREANPASVEPPNDNVPLSVEDAAEDPAALLDKVEQSADFAWDEEESETVRQARKDAELTVSVDSVRAYLKQISRVALLNAEQEVELAKRIQAGLYAAERVCGVDGVTEELSPQLRRDLCWIVRDGGRAKITCWRPTSGWSCRWPSATPAAACPFGPDPGRQPGLDPRGGEVRLHQGI